MNREQVIQTALEAGMEQDGLAFFSPRDEIDVNIEDLEKFAAIIEKRTAEAEREACAKACEEDAFVEQWKGLAEAAKRIRARGQE